MESSFVFNICSFDEAVEKIDLLAAAWKDNGIVAIPKLFPKEQELLEFLKIFEQHVKVKWFDTPNHNNALAQTGPWFYLENHSTAFQFFGEKKAEDVLVPWHLENMHYLHPQVGGAWTMRKFLCPSGSGATGFIDMFKVWMKLKQSKPQLAEFAQKARFTLIPDMGDEEAIWVAHRDAGVDPVTIMGQPSYSKKAVSPFNDNSPDVLRLCYGDEYLFSVNGEPPTLQDLEIAESLIRYVLRTCVKASDDVTIWWNWSEGDFLLVDLFRMQHAVCGGFDLGDRELAGYWAF